MRHTFQKRKYPAGWIALVILLTAFTAIAVGGLKAGGLLSAQAAVPSLVGGGVISPAAKGSNKQAIASPSGSGFTYQGSLNVGGSLANGQYDFQFTLYDALTGGNPVGAPVTLAGQTVTNGLFTVTLDFGAAAFDGNARYLEIAVSPAGQNSYVTLTPRQPITPAPYALFALKTQPYNGVVVVAKSGGDFTTITEALNSITNASADNPYLIYVAPGTYTETIAMKPYVDLEGAGEANTVIAYGSSTQMATVSGANRSELRHITVENLVGGGNGIAILNNAVSTRITNVTAIASGSSDSNTGIYDLFDSAPVLNDVTIYATGGYNAYGVYNYGSRPTFQNITVRASGGTFNHGMFNYYASPTIRNSDLSATGGTYNNGIYNYLGNPNVVTVDSSIITGSTYTIANGDSYTSKVTGTRLIGGPINNGTCAGVYDENYVFYANTCP